MKKIDYLVSSFHNMQELIKFSDQKVTAILVVCSLEVTVFINIAEKYQIGLSNIRFWGILLFVVGIIFICMIGLIIYLGIYKVLKPRFAKDYKKGTYSCYYFEHIALNSKEMLREQVEEITEDSQINELTDQIYEIARILHNKNKYCSVLMNLVFWSTLVFMIYLLLDKLL